MESKDGGAAFPESISQGLGQAVLMIGGMTLRQYAAIKLRVPESGVEWLDEMIRKAQRDELAGKAAEGLLSDTNFRISALNCANKAQLDSTQVQVSACYEYADAMLAERSKADEVKP